MFYWNIDCCLFVVYLFVFCLFFFLHWMLQEQKSERELYVKQKLWFLYNTLKWKLYEQIDLLLLFVEGEISNFCLICFLTVSIFFPQYFFFSHARTYIHKHTHTNPQTCIHSFVFISPNYANVFSFLHFHLLVPFWYYITYTWSYWQWECLKEEIGMS